MTVVGTAVARSTGASKKFTTLSVVIPNYNYERYLSDAVSSALAIDWPDVEVIVVDDGSTDGSVRLLEGFADRVVVITQENAGPRVACNRGFAVCRGDVVIFLDSDDLLSKSSAREIAKIWRPGISKVQVQMERIDSAGQELASLFPSYRAAAGPDKIRKWLLATSAYPTPPGSGNAYSREFLDRIFPLDDSCGDAADSACLATAPLLGDVLTIAKPLASYRLHRDNRSSVQADWSRLPRQIERARQRHVFALKTAGLPPAEQVPQALFRSRHLLQMRIAERRLFRGDPPLQGDSKKRQLVNVLFSMGAPGPESVRVRAAIALWCLAALGAPAPLARRLISERFH